jgi:hypothetical protein
MLLSNNLTNLLAIKKFNILEESLNKIHSSKFNYEHITYEGIKTKVELICGTHGSFTISLEKHCDGDGCPMCSRLTSAKTKIANAKTNFINIVNKRFKNNKKLDFSKFDYINSRTVGEIICSIHGSFFRTPNALSQVRDCPKCSNKKVAQKKNSFILDEILDACNTKHKKFYIYSKIEEYKNSSTISDVICPKHGVFNINLYAHSKGRKCPKCRVYINLFKVERYKNKMTILYYVKIGGFYKIGLTQSSIKSRFRYVNNIEIIDFWEYEDGAIPWKIEKAVLSETNNYKISKNISPIQEGWTEIRSKDILPTILKTINENKKN